MPVTAFLLQSLSDCGLLRVFSSYMTDTRITTITISEVDVVDVVL